MQALLEITAGPHAGRKISLSPGVPVRIGRTAKADYVVAEDTFLSGAHFYVEWSGAECVVRDLNSSNGTFLNGSRLSEATVAEGDTISAGQSSFAFRLDAAGELTGVRPAPSMDETRPIPAPYYSGSSRQATDATPPAPAKLPPSAPPLPPWAPPPYGSAQPAPSVPVSSTPPPPGPDLRPVQRALLEFLRRLADPVFAVVDGVAAKPFVDAARASGAAVEALAGESGPFIVALNPDSRAAAQFAADVWANGSAVMMTTRQPLAILRNHLRRFQTLLSQDGVEFQFRLFSPALLRVFLTTLSADEAKTFFGPISAMLMEDLQPGVLMLFKPGPEGTLHKTETLSAAGAGL